MRYKSIHCANNSIYTTWSLSSSPERAPLGSKLRIFLWCHISEECYQAKRFVEFLTVIFNKYFQLFIFYVSSVLQKEIFCVCSIFYSYNCTWIQLKLKIHRDILWIVSGILNSNWCRWKPVSWKPVNGNKLSQWEL